MIDTLMVVWTSGIWKRLLRNTGVFILLFAGICALLFFITTSGKQSTGLAVTVARSNASADVTATVQPAPTAYSTAQPFIQPIVLKNPVLPNAHNHQDTHKHPAHPVSAPVYSAKQPLTQPYKPTPSPNNPDDPTNILQNLP